MGLRNLLRRTRRSDGQIKVPKDVAERAANHLMEIDEFLEELGTMSGVEDFARTKNVPDAFLATWDGVLQAYDAYLDVMVAGAKLAVRCGSGCTGCCQAEPGAVQPAEALAIYATYRTFPDFEALQEELAARVSGAKTGPCVFLDVERGRCRVYAQRPMSCRMHFAVTEPNWCHPDDPKSAKAETYDLAPPQAIYEELNAVAEKMGLPGPAAPLYVSLDRFGRGFMGGEPLGVRRTSRRRK